MGREGGEEGGGERERKRERDIDLLFHLFMHSLVDSYMCPDQKSNCNLGLSRWHLARALLLFLKNSNL